MKIFRWFLVFCFIISLSGIAYSGEVDDEEEGSSGGNQALTGAIMGGLLGAGLGAAIGSASGHAGTGAAIGAGAGAVGGTLIGASQASSQKRSEGYVSEEAPAKSTKDMKVKKRIVREYDEEGNLISEKEVNN